MQPIRVSILTLVVACIAFGADEPKPFGRVSAYEMKVGDVLKIDYRSSGCFHDVHNELVITRTDKAVTLAGADLSRYWDEKAQKPSTTGAENFVILAVPKDASGAAPRLCALTQPTLAAMQQTRGVEAGSTRGPKNQLSTLLDGVEGSATRGASAAAEEDGPAMSARLFVFDVKP